MMVTRIYEDSNDESHFDDLDIELLDTGQIGLLSKPWTSKAVIFRQTDGSYDYDWHPSPRRQFVVLLDGEIEIAVGDGEVRNFGSGEILLLEDLRGKGHRTRQLSPGVRTSLFIEIA